MKKIYFFALIALTFIKANPASAQSVLNPADPVVTYDSTNPPQQPAYGTIGKWVRTPSLSWNTTSYKAYIYKGNAFRLKFPKTYNSSANDGKKYPMLVFFHGLGEARPIYDNEIQLYHGGEFFSNSVDSGAFDGYILCMQSPSHWDNSQYQAITELINYMVINNKLDPFSVYNNGLSDGGAASWGMLISYPTFIAASLPMSSSSLNYDNTSTANTIKFTPMWLFQGGKDGSPAPYTTHQVRDYMLAAGADLTYTEYPTLGHGTWDSAWHEPDFWPFLLNSYASNPWTLFGRTEFCIGDAINVTVGIAPGFDAYQWSKNGTIISGATANSINVTDTGMYAARVKRGSIWSDWSHVPAHIKIKSPTLTPPITVSGLMSKVIPAPDGKNYVDLQIPDNGYTSYTWKQVGSSTVIGSNRIQRVTQPGDYIVAATEQYGCSSIYSQPFHVVDAKGKNAPDRAKNLTALTLSFTKIELDWGNNPSPAYNETAFEIYRSTVQGTSYQFVGKVPADTLSYVDSGLTPNVKYYYIVRAVNENGAAPVSNEASAITQSDVTPPTAPDSLRVIYATNSSVTLAWDSSTDNVALTGYDIYVNGIKTSFTTQTSFVIDGLKSSQTFAIYVKARDASGNSSTQSNQVSAASYLQGFYYQYYEGTWTKLPDFNKLTPVKTGISKNVDISIANDSINFGFLWQGFLRVPVTGSYKIETYSDDGSELWLGNYNYGKPFINNDGTHTGTYKGATTTLSPGVRPITIAYFQASKGKHMQLFWTCKQLYGDTLRHEITDDYFNDKYTPGSIPLSPANLAVTAVDYQSIKLNWTDRSNNETGFEIYRSLTSASDFKIVATTDSNATSYVDTALTPSTRYYYRIYAVNNYGTSGLNGPKSATTASKPSAPAKPTSLVATANSSSTISLTWHDNATTETGYLVYRSLGDTLHFKIVTSLRVNSVSYADTTLFAHLTYFYRVTVLGVANTSANSSITSAKTKNDAPVIITIPNRSVRYGVTTTIQLTGTDVNSDKLTYSLINKPSFVTLTNNSDNLTATLTLNPSSSQTGNYNIQAVVNDGYGGYDTTTFTITVNSNYDPTIDSITDYSINEGDSLNINLTGHDLNNDNLSWTITNAPAGFNVTKSTSTSAVLHIHTTYASANTYAIQVTANDGNGGMVTRQFNLIVNDKSPNQTIYARFMAGDSIGAPWNTITGTTTNNLKDASNNTTTVGLAIQSSWWGAYNGGPQTGNNSGVYPDAVLKDYYYFGTFGGPDSVSIKVTGLNKILKYNLTFYAGSIYSGLGDNGNTTYTIGSKTVSLYVQNNTKNTVTIYNVQPDATGSIVFKMGKASNAPIGYINSVVINSVYDDGTAPITPQLISAQVKSKGVDLTWQDLAYNETSYNIYRATNLTGPYTLLDTTAADATLYTDTAINGNTQYYYKLQAVNAHGKSDSSNAVGVYVANRAPVIANINNIVIKNNQQLTVNVTAKDDAIDHVTLTASQLPPFVTFTDNGNGTGQFLIQPVAGVIGYYPNVTITATDNSDSSSSDSFDITVTDNATNSVYLNFSDGNTSAGKPWNNLGNWPASGATYSNILDQNNQASGISLTLVNGFQGNFGSGMHPGNGKTVYPEAVLRTGLYEGSTAAKTIKITGLSVSKKYNFIFFNSHEDGLIGQTNFTVNGQTVSLNASYNTDKTVEINNISSDANGQVVITVTKAAGADYAYLNSLIIQSYDSSVGLLSPSDLRVVDTKRNSVSLQWADRSYNETGIQVWRADESNNTYSLITTLPPNTVTYTDAGLNINKTYYYAVRAVTASANSDYSNVAVGHTLAYAVYVNFTAAKLGPSPWNNTNAAPQAGLVFDNLYDDAVHLTGLSLNEVSDFAGDFAAGMSTGNNSGVFPDNVLAESYIVFPGETGVFKLTGLNVNMKYNLTFTGSSQTYGIDINASYTVNNKTVILDASGNTQGKVTMYDVVPDENGEVNIVLTTGTSSAEYALMGAVVIQGFDSTSHTVPAAPVTQGRRTIVGLQSNVQKQGLQQNINDVQIKAYPNPFISGYNLSVSVKQNENVNVVMYTSTGKMVYASKFGNLLKGENTLTIHPGLVTPGVYIVKLIFDNGTQEKTVNIIKQ